MATKNTNGDKKEEKNISQNRNKKKIPTGKKQQDSDVLDMNLAEGEIIHYFSWKRASFILLTLIILVILLLLGVSKGISMWGEKRVEQNKTFSQNIQEIEDQIEEAKNEAESLFIFKKKLELANKLLDRHIYWTNFFNYLEESTLEDVYYTDFQGSINGEYSLPVKANDYSVIDSQVKQMRKKENTESVEVRKATQKIGRENKEEVAGKRVDLNMKLKIDEQLFIK